MIFPLRKESITFNSSPQNFLSSYVKETEIPLLPHPGAFSCVRKNHIHEGVDIYCENFDTVYAMTSGVILDIFPFTGEQCGTPWWNNTWAILIESDNYVLNYGELIPHASLVVGQNVNEGDIIGAVTTVLSKYKGRPMNMLHLEKYKKGTQKALSGWTLNTPRPLELLDPTDLLIEAARQNKLLKEEL